MKALNNPKLSLLLKLLTVLVSALIGIISYAFKVIFSVIELLGEAADDSDTDPADGSYLGHYNQLTGKFDTHKKLHGRYIIDD